MSSQTKTEAGTNIFIFTGFVTLQAWMGQPEEAEVTISATVNEKKDRIYVSVYDHPRAVDALSDSVFKKLVEQGVIKTPNEWRCTDWLDYENASSFEDGPFAKNISTFVFGRTMTTT